MTATLDQRDAIRAVREIVRRGILSAKSLRVNDDRYLAAGRRWEIVYGRWDPGAWAQIDYEPSGHELDQALVVMDWLVYVRQSEGKHAMLRIIAWAVGTPRWAMAKKEGVSEKTIERRIDRSIASIINHFFDADLRIVVVDEPYKSTPFAMTWDSKASYTQAFGGVDNGARIKVSTVYVHGQGLMRNGKRWNDGRRKAERYM